MYQVRFVDGEITNFRTFDEMRPYVARNKSAVEKISFNGPDGTRIRLLQRSTDNFALTAWMDVCYVEIGYE